VERWSIGQWNGRCCSVQPQHAAALQSIHACGINATGSRMRLPPPDLIFSPYMPHADLIYNSTASLILVNLVPSADASSSFWLVHGAVLATSPPQKFARHVQRPRSACELACSDQWPASRVQKNKKKLNIPVWAENL
jgi:hypothetical protein